MKDKKYKYKNITISGLPGSGNTTLLNNLREVLKFDGWKGFSGGEFMRAYAIEKGLLSPDSKMHHDPTIYGENFDREVDFGIREKLKTEQHWIIESKLSGFMAQGIDGVLKVLIYCSDESVRIDRIVNRDQVTPAQAKANFEERLQIYKTKWADMYKDQWDKWVVKRGILTKDDPVDFWNPKLYDLAIDSFSNNQQQCVNIVLDALRN